MKSVECQTPGAPYAHHSLESDLSRQVPPQGGLEFGGHGGVVDRVVAGEMLDLTPREFGNSGQSG